MNEVDPRLVAALRRQLACRPADAVRVGWKFGSGDGERIGGEIAVGHLTSATTLVNGATYRDGGSDLHADAELAVELGDNHAIRRYAAALEIVDLSDGDDPESVVASNDYHRAVAFDPFMAVCPPAVEGTLYVNGQPRARASGPEDIAERLAAMARVLNAVGEGLQAGDRVITGLIVQVEIVAGDEVLADLGVLGRVKLSIA